MSSNYEHRLDVVEEKLGVTTQQGIVVYARFEESADDCIRRNGRDPDAEGVQYVIVRFVAPGDIAQAGNAKVTDVG